MHPATSCCLLPLLLLLLLAAACSRADLLALTDEQKQAIVDKHNELRQKTANGNTEGQPTAANMPLLEWDERLAQTAATWAVQCTPGHDAKENRLAEGYLTAGQNWAGGSMDDPLHFVQLWFDEYTDYNYNTQGCSNVCGHYTQVVWANSLQIGCAYAKCSGSLTYSLVCNYAPAGNYIGEKPYASGPPASKCEGEFTYAEDGVCVAKDQRKDTAAAACTVASGSCLNGATFDASSCKCNCSPDFYGTRCEKACSDGDNNMYSSACAGLIDQCNLYAAYCTKTCDLCHSKARNVLGDKAGIASTVA